MKWKEWKENISKRYKNFKNLNNHYWLKIKSNKNMNIMIWSHPIDNMRELVNKKTKILIVNSAMITKTDTKIKRDTLFHAKLLLLINYNNSFKCRCMPGMKIYLKKNRKVITLKNDL
jgi:selenocysteine-specific translation elongation factor